MKTDRQTIYIAIIIAATLAVFFPTIQNGFTNWDDGYYLVNNPDIRSLSAENIGTMFSSFYVAQYVPLVVLSFAVEFHFFGLDPFIVHFTSLFLHLVTTVMVFSLVRRWKFSDEVAFFAALMFGIHPLHVEAVAWTSARKDTLSTVFLIGSMLMYYRSESDDERFPVRYYLLSLGLFLCAMGSKATVMFLPFFLLAEAAITGKPLKRIAVKLVPYFVVSIFFAGLVLYSLGSVGGVAIGKRFSLLETVSIAAYDIVFYIGKTIYPAGLSSVYPFPDTSGGSLPAAMFISLAAVIAATAAILIFRKKTVQFQVPLAFFVIALLPTLQFVSFGSMIVADRFMYVPLLGLLVVISQLLHQHFIDRFDDVKKTAVLIGMIALSYGAVTWNRVAVWKDSETLWTDAIQHYPNFPISYFSRGQHYFMQGRYDKAYADFSKAIDIAPNYPDALNMRGYLSAVRGDLGIARKDFDKVLAIEPSFALAYYNRGLVSLKENNNDSAIADLSRAIFFDKTFVEPYLNRGILLEGKRRFREAVTDLTVVIQSQPDNIDALIHRGSASLKLRNYDAAMTDLQHARMIEPGRKEVNVNLSLLYEALGKKDSAQFFFERADEVNR
ncbi:MAG: tetratricopeptide repeat protein [Bacteroidota bacterium]